MRSGRRMVVAPDSFKGSLPAWDVAEALKRGIGSVWPDAEVVSLPLSDGGEGWVVTMVRAAGGELVSCHVTGPLGQPVEAAYGLLTQNGRRIAVIEMAAASGLHLVPERQRDLLVATTRGTGELIRDALGREVNAILVGIGGSATNDAGAGMASALGARFLDASGEDLPPGGAALARLGRVDISGLDPRIVRVEVSAACDVDNPLLGKLGASVVYGPQKGASEDDVALLDRALFRFADLVEDAVGKRLRDEPGVGAAGGLGFGLMAFCGATLKPGIELALDALGADEQLANADLVITAEGRVDAQTLHGKVPHGVARRARRHGVPVIAVGGTVEPMSGSLAARFETEGIDVVVPTLEEPVVEQAALDPEATAARLERTAARLAHLLDLGAHL